eukprot:scaffold1342_cov204-Pinguiococcus_pyrenoidosus.AAC.12
MGEIDEPLEITSGHPNRHVLAIEAVPFHAETVREEFHLHVFDDCNTRSRVKGWAVRRSTGPVVKIHLQSHSSSRRMTHERRSVSSVKVSASKTTSTTRITGKMGSQFPRLRVDLGLLVRDRLGRGLLLPQDAAWAGDEKSLDRERDHKDHMHDCAVAKGDLIGLVFAAQVVVLERVVLEKVDLFFNSVIARGEAYDNDRDQTHQDHEGEQHPLEARLLAPNDLRASEATAQVLEPARRDADLVNVQGEDEQGEHEHAEEDVEPHQACGSTKGPPRVLERFAIEIIVLEQIRVRSAGPAIHIVVNAKGSYEELRLEIIYERAGERVVSDLELSPPQLPRVDGPPLQSSSRIIQARCFVSSENVGPMKARCTTVAAARRHAPTTLK